MIFIVQDRQEDPMHYIGSFTLPEAAADLIRDLEEQDQEDREYEPDRYSISRKEICFSDHSISCGNCTNCICMLEHPERDCPAAKKERSKAADRQETANDRTAAPICS